MISKLTNKTKAKVKHRRTLAFMPLKQQGFTLIELLVVVSILAALAGITSVAMDGYQQDAEEQITLVEMQRIANAIRRFKADTGYWPKTETALPSYASENKANFSFLFNKPDNVPEWNIEYAIGWHGPYINLDAIRTIIIDPANSPKAGCKGLENNVVTAVTARLGGLVDRFQQIRENNSGTDYCVLIRDKNTPSEFKVAEYSASPYLYDANYSNSGSTLCPSTSSGCVVIRSFGADGIDDDGIDASDDIVFVLEQKS